VKELVCIVCPVGCTMLADVTGCPPNITGNRCPRGKVYALEEITAPKRTVTATCAVVLADGGNINGPRRVPVKTSVPCPVEMIPALLADIYGTGVTLPVKLGEVVITDWNGCGIDVVATRSIA